MKNYLEFGTKVFDKQTGEYVNGGVRIEISEKEALLLDDIMKRAHTAQRWGIATQEGQEDIEDLETQLADEEKTGFSYSCILVVNGEAVAGSNGL